MTKTKLLLALRNNKTKEVTAYEVLPGLYAHRSFVFGRGCWQLSHSSGLGVGCTSNTRKNLVSAAQHAQAECPLDWTQSANALAQSRKGADWCREFHHAECRL